MPHAAENSDSNSTSYRNYGDIGRRVYSHFAAIDRIIISYWPLVTSLQMHMKIRLQLKDLYKKTTFVDAWVFLRIRNTLVSFIFAKY